MARLSRDSFEYEKRGRIIGQNHHEAAIRARARELLRIGGAPPSGGGGSAGITPSATRSAAAHFTIGSPSKQTVLKVVNWTKGRQAPMMQAKYAARTRDRDPAESALPMFNEAGRELRGAEIAAEVRSWNLKPDSENLSPAARAATDVERAAMPISERLQKRQAVHLIFSVPSHAPVDAQRLKQAVEAALRDTVDRGGFRYLATIHTDHSHRPHAHIIIKATSEPLMIDGREKTTQLRLGPRELDTMRHVFTRHAREQGLDVVATRREDRAHLRDEILAGTAPLRENQRLNQATRRTRQSKTFERKAPQWYAEQGAAYERRRLAAASVEPGAPAVATVVGSPQKCSGGLLGRLAASLGKRSPEPNSPSNVSGNDSVMPSWGYFDNFKTGRKPAAPEASVNGSDQPTGAAPKNRGYFENFENYRNGAGRTKVPGVSAATAEAKIAAHFAATHRDSERAADSFRAMLRESPRLALWTANNHPIAFGEPTGAAGPGLGSAEIRGLMPPAIPKSAPPLPRRLDPVLAGERQRVREQTTRARADHAAKRAPEAIGRSLARVAARLEQVAPTDPDAKERADHVRGIVRALLARDAPTRDHAHDQGRRIEAAKKDRVALYKELEDQLQRRGKGRGLMPPTASTAATPPPALPRPLAPALAGDGRRPRDHAPRVSADQVAQPAPPMIRRSLAGLAYRIGSRERPNAKEHADHILDVERRLEAPDAPTRDRAHDQARRIEATKKDPAALYKELEEQLRRRDKARTNARVRGRDDDGRT